MLTIKVKKNDLNQGKDFILTRKEHLIWCKKRALVYVDKGDIKEALTSMTRDLNKHKETARHKAIKLGVLLMLKGELSTCHEMRQFIEGFN